ncbi:MAG TPA: bifunctional 5,10-methylenetetrahydrofolate dehydrogenase/5,10-methenyltetrahydrofolate cyclohydrolase [Oscillospiraceae bacterium]|nr:bifunctional 5,10-methylenetetrahydrofolate dehydrogenase/5,10-methenyltetrahydrofolate cyclohydrolase [Oscillospiraceae bacterium]HNW04978.1 bifunctional 5,10-methylenetetrahydrofolate dehydrogenase/5,10-methenyltetrahydrofolate cyclohydrolase [Oscillospiraceae bacterium]HPW00159.1 bifunctional 5,10-methylenetetrahydrofolate dehydrogenase/5,10-methenyltetrahydrofolate cyclohydrolase [Oscillospiraceae bacterium]
MAQILYGKDVAAALAAETAEKVSALREKGIVPALALVRAGDGGGDAVYARGILRRCEKAGISVIKKEFPADASEDEVLSAVKEAARDPAVHGLLVFRPLPGQISDEKIRAAIPPEKDVDGVTDLSLAGVFTGSGGGFAPCTAEACVRLLDGFGVSLRGKSAAVVGRSLVVGKPLAMLLTGRDATVTLCHTKTKNLAEICARSEIVVAAAGRPGLLGKDCFAEGQIVLDVGVNVREDGAVCGDVDFAEAQAVVTAISPVPGGVGAVTSAVLIRHVAQAAEDAARRAGR